MSVEFGEAVEEGAGAAIGDAVDVAVREGEAGGVDRGEFK